MEQLLVLLHQLWDIILRAVPAFILFVLLHFYLKKVLFQPMERVLDERRRRTEGAVRASEDIVKQAASKLDEYEQALNQARAEIYRDQDQNRKRLVQVQAAAIEKARVRVNEKIAAAKGEIAAEAAQARASLATEAGLLADKIAARVLTGKN